MRPWIPLLLLTAACSGGSAPAALSASPEATGSVGRDAALDLLAACRPDACSIGGSAERAEGTRVVVIDGLPDLGPAQVLLVRGDELIDSYELDGEQTGGLRTDATGHLLVVVNGNTASKVVPLTVESGRLVDVAISGSDDSMYGDNNYSFDDNNGVLDIVVGRHRLIDKGVAIASVTWHWDGKAYVEGPCIGDRQACA